MIAVSKRQKGRSDCAGKEYTEKRYVIPVRNIVQRFSKMISS